MPTRIAVVGSLNMDLVVRTQRAPGPGETVFGDDFHTIPGGKGANQAVAAARLGAQVTMAGCVGADTFGPLLIRSLVEAGVEAAFVRTDPAAATGVGVIVLEASGQNRIVVASGANMRLAPDDVDAAEAAIARAAAIVLQLESPLPVVERALQIARRHAVTTILNPAPAQPLSNGLLGLVDYLIPNEGEASSLSGIQVDGPTSAARAAAALQARGAATVVVTLGGNGAVLVQDEMVHLPGYQVQAVDTTAAGDAFVGAFAVAVAERRPVVEAARRANAAGALAVTRLGALPSMPTRAELDEFLGKT